jgi:uncharacterized protein (TIGR03382 family)
VPGLPNNGAPPVAAIWPIIVVGMLVLLSRRRRIARR